MIEAVERLLSSDVLDESAAKQLGRMLSEGQAFGQALSLSGASEKPALAYLSRELGFDFVELEKCSVSNKFLSKFPARVLLERHILPVQRGRDLLLVTNDPFDNPGTDELRVATGSDFLVALAPLADIDRCIKRHLGVGADTVQSMLSEAGGDGFEVIDGDLDEDMDLTEAAEGASIISFVNQVLTEAIELRATDVHIEPLRMSCGCGTG